MMPEDPEWTDGDVIVFAAMGGAAIACLIIILLS